MIHPAGSHPKQRKAMALSGPAWTATGFHFRPPWSGGWSEYALAVFHQRHACLLPFLCCNTVRLKEISAIY